MQQKHCMAKKVLLAVLETPTEFKSMLWEQQIMVYTEHKTLMQDALGLSSDGMYHWRLLLEEYGLTIM